MKQVVPLGVDVTFDNNPRKIYPVLLKDETDLVLVDCGYPGYLPIIKQASEEKGIDLDKLTKIVITHHDFDHMGALAEFKEAYPDIEIIASEVQEKFVSGKEKHLRLQIAEAQKIEFTEFHRRIQSLRHAGVDLKVKGGQVFPWLGGTEIVATPGHMPGHISVLVRDFKTFIAGDAIMAVNGKPSLPNPLYTLDMNEAKESIKKLLNYDIEEIICYHGGICSQNVKTALQEII